MFAEVVSICTGVIRDHDGFLILLEGTHCALLGKPDAFGGLFYLFDKSFDVVANGV